MTSDFQLSPFPDQTAPEWNAFSIKSNLYRLNQHLTVTFELMGPLEELSLPTLNESPGRQDNLWEHTCFEFFFGEPTSSAYWEVNLSPSGDWNLYHFSDYRTQMAEENRIGELTCQCEQSSSCLSLTCPMPLDAIALESSALELSITAVLKNSRGDLSYWAIAHTSQEADFHQRSSFTVQI